MEYQLELTFGYENSSDKRNYKFDLDDAESSTIASIKTGIQDINASLAGGTSGGLNDFFVADDYDGTNGKFNRISAATIISTEETVIF